MSKIITSEKMIQAFLNDFNKEVGTNYSVDEFIDLYSNKTMVKPKADNVWKNIYKYEYTKKGNYYRLAKVLGANSFLENIDRSGRSKNAYINAYKKKNCWRIDFQVNRKTESDIVDILSKQSNVNGFIKECIRKNGSK